MIANDPRSRPGLRGFTLAELLVVISLLVLLLAIAVPSLSGLLYSSDRTLAENRLRVAVAAGRDVALRSANGLDGAVFFLYANGRIRAVPAVQVGTLKDVVEGGADGNPSNLIERDIFVAVAGGSPVQLPPFWTVRGYAPPGSVGGNRTGTSWYNSSDNAYSPLSGNWVFPETSFFDPSISTEGGDRQTFMVRFEGLTGRISPRTGEALLVDLAPSQAYRNQAPYSNHRLDQAADLAIAVRRLLQDRPEFPPVSGSGIAARSLRELIGNVSSDTVLARPVTLLALGDERRIVAAVGLSRVNQDTGTVYGDPNRPGEQQIDPALDLSLGQSNPLELTRTINRYLEGRIENRPPEAVVFSIASSTGRLREFTP
ncbi:MAG: prepilin-type N-terminal cleavage/methylation domain-containing protein [Planctomycetota bacterium]|nr:prepilin-type N-terminal cleavage/methylation domain-containing protein [Planctomycetota bacterium]